MIRSLIPLYFLLAGISGFAQEVLTPLRCNLNYIYKDLRVEKNDAAPYASRTVTNSITIPFIEDFYYAPQNSYPDQNKWSDRMVYVNSGFPIAPPSIGVATFDGLDPVGYPYRPAGTNSGLAYPSDTLTSREINLLTTANSQTLQPADSVAITFYYQARGHGDAPEIPDSLILDFFSPGENKWISGVWAVPGNINSNVNDTVFKRGFVWIDSSIYLMDGFKFRFRNLSAASGNYDHWHLDYVYLDKDRSQKADTVYKDLVFAYVPTPFLRDYSAMPFEQFSPAEMASKNLVSIKNNGKLPVNMTYEYKIDTAGPQISFYTGGANILNPFRSAGYSSFAPHANPVVNYTFAPMSDSIDYRIKHYVFESGSSSDFIRENDTVIQYQRFRNYYAIDDGSAEAGYYLNAAQAKLAYKVNVNYADSFLAMRIYFDPVATALSQVTRQFRICVWAPGANGPGTLMFRDTTFTPFFYNYGPNRSFTELRLIRPKLLTPGTYYMGIQQFADYITFGFDVNTDHRSTTYFDVGEGWKPSEEKGSVMIRPIFGRSLPHPLGFDDNGSPAEKIFSTWPNPASDVLYIRSNYGEISNYQLFNSIGQLVGSGLLDGTLQTVSTANLDNGIYVLSVGNGEGPVQRQKIIIQR